MLDWPVLLSQLWHDPAAQQFLNQTSAKALPTRGQIYLLLSKTQQILSDPLARTSNYEAAATAVQSGACTLLAKLLYVLQQHPSEDVNHAPGKKRAKKQLTVWYYVLQTLEAIVYHISSGSQVEQKPKAKFQEGGTPAQLKLSLKQQLVDAPGEELFPEISASA